MIYNRSNIIKQTLILENNEVKFYFDKLNGHFENFESFHIKTENNVHKIQLKKRYLEFKLFL